MNLGKWNVHALSKGAHHLFPQIAVSALHLEERGQELGTSSRSISLKYRREWIQIQSFVLSHIYPFPISTPAS
jgi:hypothetical protein